MAEQVIEEQSVEQQVESITQEVTGQTETTEGTNTEVITEVEQTTKPEGEVKSEKEKEIMIPKDRFDEINGKYKETSDKLNQFETKYSDLEKELQQLKSKPDNSDDVKTLQQKLDEQANQYKSLVEQMYSSKLKSVPEDYHDLIPEGLSPEQKIAFIEKAEEKGIFTKKQVTPVGTVLNHSSDNKDTEAVNKMNPVQMLKSYYGTKK